ncbi:hypothetical protein [Robertmurraya sp.]|uniref:hypothetical protein n=1 Tax=Robertmurraya sp. TaxID=2837525 RepID=UPI003704BF4A
MSFFDWFKRTPSPTELMKKREDMEFIEQIKRMAVTVTDRGAMTNHGLSEYGAQKLLEEGRQPNVLEQRVLLKDGTFISFEEWKERNSK